MGRKKQWAYRVQVSRSTGYYRHCYVTVMSGCEIDAAEQYDQHGTDHYLQRLAQIRSEGTSTRYFEVGYGGALVAFRFQTDPEAWEDGRRWYGCDVDNAELTEDSVRAIRLGVKAHQGTARRNLQPEQLVAALEEQLKARRVEYGRAYDSWIYQDEPFDLEAAVDLPAAAEVA